MFKSINIFKNLNLNRVGLLELLFALTPLLSGYGLAGLPLSLIMWVVLIALVVIKNRTIRIKNFVPMTILVAYVLIHDVAIVFIDDMNFNGFIEQAIFFLAFYFLYPSLNVEKLRGSLNWVALIAIIGLLYQWTFIAAGGGVHPLEIPGLSMSEERLDTFSIRPSSFFMEPAAYVAFMICPLALSLIDRQYPWSIIMILSIFLTTSTTGIVLSFIMLAMSLFSGRMKKWSAILLVVAGVGLYYSLTHVEAFEYGLEKYENTDVESNVRLRQGMYVVSTMHAGEYVFGVPYGSPYNYCMSGRAPQVAYYGNSVYMSTFWYMILCYGVVGLILYLNIYLRIARKSRQTWPLITCLVTVMFSSSYRMSGTFIFTLVLLMLIVSEYSSTSVIRDQRKVKSIE